MRAPRRGRLAMAVSAAWLMVIIAGTQVVAGAPGWTDPVQAFAARFQPDHDMTIDTQGKIHLVTEGGADPGLWYVTNAGGSWVSQRVSSGEDHSPSIDLDGGNVYIAFHRLKSGGLASKGIFTATDATGSWTRVKRHSGNEQDPSLQTRNGRYHIAFVDRDTDPAKLHYLSNASGTWDTQLVDGECCDEGGGPSLQLNSQGRPRIAFRDIGGEPPMALGEPDTGERPGIALASRSSSGSWTIQVVTGGFQFSPTLALEARTGLTSSTSTWSPNSMARARTTSDETGPYGAAGWCNWTTLGRLT